MADVGGVVFRVCFSLFSLSASPLYKNIATDKFAPRLVPVFALCFVFFDIATDIWIPNYAKYHIVRSRRYRKAHAVKLRIGYSFDICGQYVQMIAGFASFMSTLFLPSEVAVNLAFVNLVAQLMLYRYYHRALTDGRYKRTYNADVTELCVAYHVGRERREVLTTRKMHQMGRSSFLRNVLQGFKFLDGSRPHCVPEQDHHSTNLPLLSTIVSCSCCIVPNHESYSYLNHESGE